VWKCGRKIRSRISQRVVSLQSKSCYATVKEVSFFSAPIFVIPAPIFVIPVPTFVRINSGGDPGKVWKVKEWLRHSRRSLLLHHPRPHFRGDKLRWGIYREVNKVKEWLRHSRRSQRVKKVFPCFCISAMSHFGTLANYLN
jgi:hypothetical protein